MDVVAHARTVDRGEIRSEDAKARHAPERCLTSPLDEMGCARCRLARAAFFIGTGHVEIAQRRVTEIMGLRGVAQHPLRHQFGAAIGIDRIGRRIFRNRHRFGCAVNRGRGREHEILDAFQHAGFDQCARRRGVVGIVEEGVLHGLRHHHRAREMDHRVDAQILDQLAHQRDVGDVAFDESRGFGHQAAYTGTEIVQNDGMLAPVDQRMNHMAADIPGPTRDKNAHTRPRFAVIRRC